MQICDNESNEISTEMTGIQMQHQIWMLVKNRKHHYEKHINTHLWSQSVKTILHGVI